MTTTTDRDQLSDTSGGPAPKISSGGKFKMTVPAHPMTNDATNPVEVTQADYDRAEPFLRRCLPSAWKELPEAFARHRIAQAERVKTLEEGFRILMALESALVLTAEYNPTTNVQDFTRLSTEFGKAQSFLRSQQYTALEQTGDSHG